VIGARQPRIQRNKRGTVFRRAKGNCGQGHRPIIGELSKLPLRLGRSSIRRILLEDRLTPSPVRGMIVSPLKHR
jgi:hypothetical protein